MDVAQAQFALDLVHELFPNATTSVVVSPLSIILALSLAYVGAAGDTRKEFQQRFGVNGVILLIHNFLLPE
jgi:serine protease inhibitor